MLDNIDKQHWKIKKREMTTQSYYKDRLGFDPNEAVNNDGHGYDTSQHGYEENLSKFKGLWGFFIAQLGTVIYFIF